MMLVRQLSSAADHASENGFYRRWLVKQSYVACAIGSKDVFSSNAGS